MHQFEHGLMWFRRDLRIEDNAALHQALRQCRRVSCVFVFDSDILSTLPATDRRVTFIDDCITELDHKLQQAGAGLIVRYGAAHQVIPELAKGLNVDAVFAVRDYEPQAQVRDAAVADGLKREGSELVLLKDQVIFEMSEILNGQGKPYRVFTAYKNAWLRALRPVHIDAVANEPLLSKLEPVPSNLLARPSLEDMGFTRSAQPVPVSAGSEGAQALFADFLPRMDAYQERRDFPAAKGPSYLSVHLRFGTISLRALVRAAYPAMQSGSAGATTWLSELIWRDFYFMILHHFPHVTDHAFRAEYDAIEWESGADADVDFEAWCSGQTGYPIVDAAMRQLNQTGYMHNRLRMIVASFLTKDLGIDWRRGEQYFARQLNDFDLAANNGGWQWAASTGCDAQPYFRIFNPVAQSQKFDAQGDFIRRYVPEVAGLSNKDIHAPWLAKENALIAAKIKLGDSYPKPIVNHQSARKVALARYDVSGST
ncbi:deoxyribodipyrimidine photo-lyase [Pusillimonas sp. ANT_WB101]|uniref:cryptochrome/photolyase family protein n=1 Tax=Pusillimonas sp. ANT_WB101 TaxID=2597356 RepID=UPI0011EE6812|nr:deoxyribodipyrimidine photo-lyase [Pusillimonas sp. ANT_WB101]KAA0892871.1 deoxyribodipyrimidine photo-lyase [Pusillimonas sp. ANT_WB101]